MTEKIDIQRVYEFAEDCVALGRYTEAAGLLTALLSDDPEPDRPRIRQVLDSIVDIADDPTAKITLAVLLKDPAVDEPDDDRAFALLREAADQVDDADHPEHGLAGLAHGLLGDSYLNGEGVFPDPEAGYRHYAIAAGHGNAKAALNVGMAAEAGLFDESVDQERAKHFYRIGADGGEAAAMTRLAILHLRDLDAPEEVLVLDLLEKAAELGDQDAVALLETLTEEARERGF